MKTVFRPWAAWAVLAILGPASAQADGLAALDRFVREVQSGQAQFTQTVTPPVSRSAPGAAAGRGAAPNARPKVSLGRFEFQRPQRFLFEYTQPNPQRLISDGRTLWVVDPDLQQASQQALGQALGATPAALLAGEDLRKNFVLEALPDAEGLQWVLATARTPDASVPTVRVGFAGDRLARLELIDALGQRSVLVFEQLKTGVKFPVGHFQFVPPPGMQVIQAP